MSLLSGKTVLVTGATKGIGSEIVKALHAEGANVIGHFGRDNASAEQMLARYPERLDMIQADLARADGAATLWRHALEVANNIDVLVNNAGIYVASPLNRDEAWQQGWQANLQVNLQAPADLCRFAIEHYTERGGGIIINMASRSSHRGDGPEHLAYGAAKGGLLALTKGIARGYGDRNVLAYALAPGWVRTAMAEDHIASVGEAAVTANLPLREVTPPSDVAAMVSFLASGRCRHATGSTIDITGADYVR
ncbi:SDR family NAD(P)-dependent oxidoreductase [Candidatus Pantoea multigeneris]|uniref:SDR family oxidoreductase n=1 Tax=Candidatus Pantoea multigeneris TaxID=2608357 RepID=A0ABX0R8D3_9GAMM|nr:SDR family oxidoreductase [Pantoea multigeneris]NIF21615.1 SDR family oxidoreductase [Pantoea multigeneris]